MPDKTEQPPADEQQTSPLPTDMSDMSENDILANVWLILAELRTRGTYLAISGGKRTPYTMNVSYARSETRKEPA